MIETEVTYKFKDLSEKAKQKAREEYTSGDYPGYDWWDNTYEDAVRMAEMLGIQISTTVRGRGRSIDIWFSGFCSQGDGASFDGWYDYAPKAVEQITSECSDEELLRIAQELTLMQLTQRLKGLEEFSGYVKSSRDNCIATDIRDWGIDEIGEPDEDQFKGLMQDFADWIYKQLEAEHDYYHSDAYVDERLSESDDEYDEDGVQI
jgi:hypothetical protein